MALSAIVPHLDLSSGREANYTVSHSANEVAKVGCLRFPRILEEEPKNTDVLDLLGSVAFRLGDFAAASSTMGFIEWH